MLKRHWRTVTTPPTTTEVVTLNDMKSHINLAAAITLYDNDLTFFIRSAQEWWQRATDMILLAQSIDWTIEATPAGKYLWLPFREVRSITAINYTDSDGSSQLVDPGDYEFIPTVPPGVKYTAADVWPVGDNLIVSADVGYVDDAWPNEIVQVVKMMAALYFENREAADPLQLKEVPLAIQGPVERWQMGNSYMLEAD